jgi:hypothetical protein
LLLLSPFTSSARARARWSTSAPAKTCTAAGGAISAGQRANGKGGSLSGEAASRYGNARSVARARDRAARDGRELAVRRVREGSRARGWVAARKAEGGRLPRGSFLAQRSRAGIARTHSALHLVLGPVPVRLGGLVPVFLPVDDGRDEAGARESATTAHGATGVAGQGKTEGGVRGRTPPHGPIAVGDGFRRTHTSSHFAVVSTMCASKSACRFAGSSILLARNRVSHPMVSRTGRTARALGMPAKVTTRAKTRLPLARIESRVKISRDPSLAPES